MRAISLLMVMAGLAILIAYGLGFGRTLRTSTATSTTSLAAALPTPHRASSAPPEVAAGAPLGSLPPPASLRIDSIGLEAPVQPAPLVEVDGGLQWEVPAFAAGHGEGTANPGEAGNAVFMGHVQSVAAGEVFRDLHLVQVGQEITFTAAGAETTVYQVVDVRTVTPGEVSVVAPTPDPTVTLITCAGQWLPQARDYSERLIVVGKLQR
jgi:sortase A